MRIEILLVGSVLAAFGCQSEGDNGDVIIPSVERDMMRTNQPRITDFAIPDMISTSDGSVLDSSTAAPDAVIEDDAGRPDAAMAIDSGPLDAATPDAGGTPVPPTCVANGQNCGEVCRWVAECAFAGGCVAEEVNRPALITSCLRTCNGTPPYADIMCGFNSCVPTLDLANNDGGFAALCRGEDPPEMNNDQGVAECIALNQCLGDCMGVQACLDACYANATPEANQRFQAIITCLQENQCFTPAGQLNEACLEQNCLLESERCLGPQVRPIGQGTCNELLACLNACQDGDRACVNVCVQLSSPASFELYRAAVNCVQDNCIGNDPQCQQQNCGMEINACVAN